jgi:hypothetical protein
MKEYLTSVNFKRGHFDWSSTIGFRLSNGMEKPAVFGQRQVLILIFLTAILSPTAVAQGLPRGWRRPTQTEVAENWRMKSYTRFMIVKGEFDGDGKVDVAELLVGRSVQQCALFVWLTSQHNNPSGPIWHADQEGLINIGIRLAHPGKHETLCSSDPSECEPQTPAYVNLKGNGIELFSRGATRSLAFWDVTTKKFRWVPIGD